jgi:hypothetical protein
MIRCLCVLSPYVEGWPGEQLCCMPSASAIVRIKDVIIRENHGQGAGVSHQTSAAEKRWEINGQRLFHMF